jgi:predicted ATPase/DNA-binding winged helix-turn-helix (wHTH) protein
VYESGAWLVDLEHRELRAQGVPVPIGGRAFEIIEVLVESAGELVTKDDLMARVWPGAAVGENTLQVHISAVRKAFAADRGMVKTESGRGYRLLGDWAGRHGRPASDAPRAVPDRVQPCSTRLPAAISDLIGRSAAIGQLMDLVTAYRAVTLTGPGGIGKTVLALEVARRLLPSFRGEACLVELAALSDPALVSTAVASALGVKSARAAASPASVAAAIGQKQLLLVIDNCEHVIDAAAEVVETIVRMCPRTSVLATSREILRIAGEYVYRVAPLEVPAEHQDATGDVLGHSAVQLFLARTRALQADFARHAESLPAIAAICRRLDGMPLAIEFAAARSATLGLQEIASRLNARFELLAGGRRTALPRHRTLRATVDWSYQLLPEAERRLLRRLAVFAGGFTLEAATAVMGDGGEAASAVVEGIASLAGKSFLSPDGSAPADRWRLLETIRAYALEKLAESGEAEAAARSHAAFFRTLFAAAATGTPAQPAARPAGPDGREIDNVRAAIDWSLAPGGDLPAGLDLVAAAAPLWFQLSLMGEYRERVERALHLLQAAPAPDAQVEMRLQSALGHALWYSANDPDVMERAFARALAIAERVGDAQVQLQALWGLWAARRGRGEYRAALALASQYDLLARQAGDPSFIALAERILGLTYHYLGEQAQARRLLEHVRSQSRHAGQATATDFQLAPEIAAATLLCRIEWLQGFPDRAAETAQQAIAAAQQTEHWFSICYVLYIAGCALSLWVGDLAEAQQRLDLMVGRAAGNAYVDTWARCYALVLRLRHGSEQDRLIAACIEPRLDVATVPRLAALASAPGIALPLPGPEPEEAPWSLPEVWRAEAELLLWNGGSDAQAEAEAKLRRALDLARAQGSLSWELRSATSLARLWHSRGRAAAARDLLARSCDRFTEGFDTGDLAAARRLLAAWE